MNTVTKISARQWCAETTPLSIAKSTNVMKCDRECNISIVKIAFVILFSIIVIKYKKVNYYYSFYQIKHFTTYATNR